MKQAIRYLLIFVAIQLIGGAIIQGVWSLVAGSGDKTAAMLITITGVVGLLTITVFLWARYAVVSPTWLRTRPWMVLTWSVIAALGALIPSAFIHVLRPDSHEPRSDAARLPHRITIGLDVLAHRLYSAWSSLPLGQQQRRICALRHLSQSRYQAD